MKDVPFIAKTDIAQSFDLIITDGTQNVFFESLVERINELIVHDFNKLISLLYRLDINETKMRAELASHPKAHAGRIIATLVVERQVEKINSRAKYQSPGSDNIDENEKW